MLRATRLTLVPHDAAQAACEQEHIQERLECVAIQIRNGGREFLHVLGDALISSRQPCNTDLTKNVDFKLKAA